MRKTSFNSALRHFTAVPQPANTFKIETSAGKEVGTFSEETGEFTQTVCDHSFTARTLNDLGGLVSYLHKEYSI